MQEEIMPSICWLMHISGSKITPGMRHAPKMMQVKFLNETSTRLKKKRKKPFKTLLVVEPEVML